MLRKFLSYLFAAVLLFNLLTVSGCLIDDCPGFIGEPFVNVFFSDDFSYDQVEIIDSDQRITFSTFIEFPLNPNKNITTGVFRSGNVLDTLEFSYSIESFLDIEDCGTRITVEGLEITENTTFNNIVVFAIDQPEILISAE